MPKCLTLRPLAEDELRAIDRLAHARTEAHRTVERAQIIWRAHEGERAPAVAEALGVDTDTVRRWLTRFNASGLAGLADEPRAGRPPTYTGDEVGTVIAASLTDPVTLQLPFSRWTLDRLTTYLHETKGLAISRSWIGEILQREGLRWRTQAPGLGARGAPAVAAKRGPSAPSTRPHRRTAP